ncbi:MAG: hypothetical protein ACOYMN_25715, partial [Roseimicrobium sp.]
MSRLIFASVVALTIVANQGLLAADQAKPNNEGKTASATKPTAPKPTDEKVEKKAEPAKPAATAPTKPAAAPQVPVFKDKKL